MLIYSALLAVSTALAAPDPLKPDEQGLALLVEPFADGLVRHDRWTALRVIVVNAGNATQGELSISEPAADGGEPTQFSRSIELPRGAKKEVWLSFSRG